MVFVEKSKQDRINTKSDMSNFRKRLNIFQIICFICMCYFRLFQSYTIESSYLNTGNDNKSNSSPVAEAYSDIKNDKLYTLFAAGDTMIARWMHYLYYEKGRMLKTFVWD